MEGQTIIVVAGGSSPPARLPGPLPDGAAVIAADGGVDRAQALGLHVDLAVGDFDSVSPAGLAAAERAGANVVRHPAEKEATDLELALDAALARSPARILVVADGGGRLDHLLASLLILGLDRYDATEIDAYVGQALVHVVRARRTLHGSAGELISLLPLHGPAEGVSTTGLRYPLSGETLAAGSSRGVSNVFTGGEAQVAVGRGLLLALRPGSEHP